MDDGSDVDDDVGDLNVDADAGSGAGDIIEYNNNKDSDTDPCIEKLQQELATVDH